MLTDKQRQDYLEAGANACPYCQSVAISMKRTPIGQTNIKLYQNVKCTSCGETWTDQYKLVDVLSV